MKRLLLGLFAALAFVGAAAAEQPQQTALYGGPGNLAAPAPGDYPTLQLDFATNESLDSRIAFSRSSTATYWDSSGTLQEASSGSARFDHDPSDDTPLGLLVEEGRTNLLTRSEEFDHADWDSGAVVVTADQAVAPDGTTTADEVAHRGGGGSFDLILQTPSASASTQYAGSLFVKNVDSTKSRFRLFDGATNIATVDVSWSGATLDSFTPVGTSPDDWGFEDVGDGWYRIWAVATTGGAATSVEFQFEPDDAADGKSVYMWGAQFEEGATRSSYAPTTSATNARADELPTLTHNPPSTFTIVLEARTGLGSGVLWSWDDGTAAEEIFVERNSSNEIHLKGDDNSSAQFDIDLGTVADETDFTIAFRIGENDIAASLDGGAVVTDTTATLPTVTTERIGNDFQGNNHWNGWIRSLRHWDSANDNDWLRAKAG